MGKVKSLYRCLSFVLAVGFATVAAAGPAAAQTTLSARVIAVIDGDTVAVEAADGRLVTIQLIGIEGPDPGECGAEEAKAALEWIALGRNVVLVSDPGGAAVTGGRAHYYADRDDGVDLGLEQVRAGWTETVGVERSFARMDAYVDAEDDAETGVWQHCDGDFHRTRADEGAERRASAVTFIERYYRLIGLRRFATAWAMVGRRARRDIGSFASWKAGHRRSLGSTVTSARARLSGSRAVVVISLRTRDRDACSGREVVQRFRGSWNLAPRGDGWVAIRAHIHKVGGGHVRLSKAECAPVRPPTQALPPVAPEPPMDCQGYSPCITPGSDVDCDGGSGNGPRYIQGPVSVSGPDPYGLDSDGDGVACET